MRGWRPALRLAWRDAWQAKARSILVLVMIALPVFAVTAAAVVQATSEVSGVESIPRTMGAAQARVEPVGGQVMQAPDPTRTGWGSSGEGKRPDRAELAALWGKREAITITSSYAHVLLGDRRVGAVPTEVDLRSPLAKGLFELSTGKLPDRPGQVVINEAFTKRGVALGDTIDVLGAKVTVVGVGRDASNRGTPTVAGMPGTFGEKFSDNGTLSWLIGGGAVTWSDVLALNQAGAVVYSRAVITDPPPVREMAEGMGIDTGYGDYVAVVSLIVVMALLEVVLLAGPAFAVSARRQARTLALMAACGGTPRQARRVVLASGVVLGAVAAVVGAVLGVLAGIALLPLLQQMSNEWFGPISVNWLAVAVVACFGLLSAFLAAVVPAWLASRQDVVAVLAGRRGDAPPRARTPVIGLLLLAAGIGLSVFGVKGGEFAIAAGAVVAVFGMIFVVPLVVSLLARFSRRFPLVVRYAARDAARHRTRTVPAVAAVAATVAGVVALGIGSSSDEAQARETYQPMLTIGDATVGVRAEYDATSGKESAPAANVWERIDAVLAERLPEVSPEVIRGQRSEAAAGGDYHLEVTDGAEPLLDSWGGGPSGATTYVSDDTVPGVLGLDAAEQTRTSAALKAGRAVVFSNRAVDSEQVRVDKVWFKNVGDGSEPQTTTHTWPATFVQTNAPVTVQLMLPTKLAKKLGEPVTRVGLYFDQSAIGQDAEKDVTERLGAISESIEFYVERGYVADESALILLLILFSLGGVLMLGGTLTATFLALSDARADLATLSAVGAAPRTRRGVAASYALVVGFVSAVLGALVGFIPGVAITYPLTSNVGQVCGFEMCPAQGPFLDIPWLLIGGLVVALPLLTAAIVGLTARSRLPLTSRLT